MRQTHVPEAAPTSAQFYTAPRPRTAPTAFLRACPEASGLARIIHERARMIAEGEQGRFEQSSGLFSPKRTPRQGPGGKREARGISGTGCSTSPVGVPRGHKGEADAQRRVRVGPALAQNIAFACCTTLTPTLSRQREREHSVRESGIGNRCLPRWRTHPV